jgi:hypothetical protein
MENKTKIILARESQWLNRLRPYSVKIDKKEAGIIANGSSEEFVVEPGTHTLSCTIFWYGSIDYEFDIKQNEIIYLVVKNGMTYYWPLVGFLFAGVFFNSFYFSYHRTEYPTWYLGIKLFYLLPMLYMLYYITIGKKKYLVIKEDKDNIFAS